MLKTVFFGRSNFQYNGFDSMKILLNDVIDDPDFCYVEPIDSKAFTQLNYYYQDRLGTAIKKRIGVPRRKLYYKEYLQVSDKINASDCIYFVFVRYEPWFFGKDGFLAYLRKEYPYSKFVYLLINVNRYLNIDFDKFCPYFDRVITIDESDALKYGLEFHPFFYSAIDKEDPSLRESDCFFIGTAKKRFDTIIKVYERLTEIGMNCDFQIVNVPDDKQKYRDRIIYNKPLNYDEIICHVKKTRILVEIMQEGQTSGTLREHEAVVYGKKLLTNNLYVTKRDFYNPDNIQVFTNVVDINTDFLTERIVSEYLNKDKISPKAFFGYLQKQIL